MIKEIIEQLNECKENCGFDICMSENMNGEFRFVASKHGDNKNINPNLIIFTVLFDSEVPTIFFHNKELMEIYIDEINEMGIIGKYDKEMTEKMYNEFYEFVKMQEKYLKGL